MPTLGQIIAIFKYQPTKERNTDYHLGLSSIWQRNFYEHIIRNKKELNVIRNYIVENPKNWEEDEENPINF